MGALAWVIMGIAVWHFTVLIPDRYWGGIVGAFVGAIAGALLFGLAIHGFDVPGQNDTDVLTALEGIPGAVLGIGVIYLVGVRRGNEPLHL